MLVDMAQTGLSKEEQSWPSSSLKLAQGLSKDVVDYEGHPDAALPSMTHSESGPSAEKPAERSSERKQPARASKRDIVFVSIHSMPLRCVTEVKVDPQSAALFESNGSGDEEQGVSPSRRSAATAAVIRERKRKAARARYSRSQQRSTTRTVKGEPAITAAPAESVNAVLSVPAPVSQSSPPMIADSKATMNPTIVTTPSQVGQSVSATPTPTLKIRLPRFSLAPAALSTKSTPASPVQVRTSERSRRSLRRQTSTTGSSSTSVSKTDGRASVSAAESPRD
jgi:hypothetical protein